VAIPSNVVTGNRNDIDDAGAATCYSDQPTGQPAGPCTEQPAAEYDPSRESGSFAAGGTRHATCEGRPGDDSRSTGGIPSACRVASSSATGIEETRAAGIKLAAAYRGRRSETSTSRTSTDRGSDRSEPAVADSDSRDSTTGAHSAPRGSGCGESRDSATRESIRCRV